MPKQIWKIDQFFGGLNNNSDPRDVMDNELSEANGVMIDEIGKIRPMGKLVDINISDLTVNLTPGRGLAAFSHDPKLATGGRILTHDGSDYGSDEATVMKYTEGHHIVEPVNITDGSAGIGLQVDVFVEKINPVDIHGNVYETILIGKQYWMKENLKTYQYNNGDMILTDIHSGADENLDTPPTEDELLAAIDFDQDTALEHWDSDWQEDIEEGSIGLPTTDRQEYYDRYGFAYSGYVIDDERGIAPEGWHVPTDEDWLVLEMEAGPHTLEEVTTGRRYPNSGEIPNSTVGAKLAGSTYWENYDDEDDAELEAHDDFGTSELDFLPGGQRTHNFGYRNNTAVYWTSTSAPDYIDYNDVVHTSKWVRTIDTGHADVTPLWYLSTNKQQLWGRTYRQSSIRCVSDYFYGQAVTITITHPGSGYSQNDEVIIPGNLLGPDGGDIKIKILTVAAESTASLPTNYLSVSSTLPAANGNPPRGTVDFFESDSDGGNWRTPLDMGELTFGEVFESATYFVDGSFKICDGNFANETLSRVYESVFLDAPNNLVVNETGSFVQKLIKPIAGIGGNSVMLEPGFAEASIPENPGQINISIEPGEEGDGTWRDTEDYTLYVTYSYRNNQESNPTILSNIAFPTVTDQSQKVNIKIYSAANLVSSRIRAINFYYSSDFENLYFLVSADLEKGVQQHNGKITLFVEEAAYIHAQVEISSPSIVTFEARNGFSPNEQISARYKTAVVANRRVYIGNIYQNFRVYGDRMLKSPVNKFDTFPESNYIDASVQDGDDIVKLEEYADRILQFKKNKMHLINISQNIEFLEDTFMHKGVSHPAATCKTDFGIAWVNNFGCYLYDGKQIRNLLEREGRQIIKESIWQQFTTNEPMIGYIPKKRQLIVVDDIGNAGDGEIYLYDIVTQSWVRGVDGTFVGEYKTNFISNWMVLPGDLLHFHTAGVLQRWNSNSYPKSSQELFIGTKDIDFGHPSQKKTVYKVYITYKSSVTSGVRVEYVVNGKTTLVPFIWPYDGLNKQFSTSSSTFFETDHTLKLTPPLPSRQTVEWSEATLIPDTPSECKNIQSFRLLFSNTGTTQSDFEINDISIAYRLKGAR